MKVVLKDGEHFLSLTETQMRVVAEIYDSYRTFKSELTDKDEVEIDLSSRKIRIKTRSEGFTPHFLALK